MGLRKHRRVRKTWGGCKCPPGSRRVSTCKRLPNGAELCRGRGWGCLGVGVSQKGRAAPRFLAALCSSPSDLDLTKPPRKAQKRRQSGSLILPPPPALTPREQSRMLPGILPPAYRHDPFDPAPGPARRYRKKSRQLRLPFTRKAS